MKTHYFFQTLLIFLLLISSQEAVSRSFMERFAIGGGIGYNNDEKWEGEAYAQCNFNTSKMPIEVRLGLAGREYKLDAAGLDKLSSTSIGLFADGVIYPFKKYFFTGIRWELLTFNWLNDSSHKRYQQATGYDLDSYVGTNFFFQVGTKIPLSSHFSMRLSLQPGILVYGLRSKEDKEYTVSVGSVDVDNVHLFDDAQFLFNTQLGLVYKF